MGGKGIFLDPLRGVTTSPCISWQDSSEDVPWTVVVERYVGDMSLGGMCKCSSTRGSAIVILAWSSMMASPSIEELVAG